MATYDFGNISDLEIPPTEIIEIPYYGVNFNTPGGMVVQNVEGQLWMIPGSSVTADAPMWLDPYTMKPMLIWRGLNGSYPMNWRPVLIDDVMIFSEGWWGTSCRMANMSTAPKTINGVANQFPIGIKGNINGMTNSTLVAGPAFPATINTSPNGLNRWSDARNAIGPKAANDTSPNITDPAAPAFAAATSGGHLADGTYYAAIAVATKRNVAKTNYGATLPCTATSVTVTGGGGAGRIDVPLPALPANAIGFIMYLGTTANNMKVVGSCPQGSVTYPIKYIQTQLALDRKMFFHHGGSIWKSSAITDVTAAACYSWTLMSNSLYGSATDQTSGYDIQFNPFFYDSCNIFRGRGWESTYGMLTLERINILNNTVTQQTDPRSVWPQYPLASWQSNYECWWQVPEMAAFCVHHRGAYHRWIGMYSAINFEQIWSMPSWNMPYGSNPGSYSIHKPADVFFVDGIPYMVQWSAAHGPAIIRTPIQLFA